jgi:hypothetical protein
MESGVIDRVLLALFKEGPMLLYGMRSLPRRFRLLLSSFQQSDSLAFADALTQGERTVNRILLGGLGWRICSPRT